MRHQVNVGRSLLRVGDPEPAGGRADVAYNKQNQVVKKKENDLILLSFNFLKFFCLALSNFFVRSVPLIKNLIFK